MTFGDVMFLAFAGSITFIYIMIIIKIRRSVEADVEQEGVCCPECGYPLTMFSPTFKPFALVCRNPACPLNWIPQKEKDDEETEK